jgi:hypothetical protein
VPQCFNRRTGAAVRNFGLANPDPERSKRCSALFGGLLHSGDEVLRVTLITCAAGALLHRWRVSRPARRAGGLSEGLVLGSGRQCPAAAAADLPVHGAERPRSAAEQRSAAARARQCDIGAPAILRLPAPQTPSPARAAAAS